MNNDGKSRFVSKKIIHEKIQLWTSYPEEEYAIRLLFKHGDKDNMDFIATTNHNAKYEKIVAEMDIIKDLKLGWDQVLRHFIDSYRITRLEDKDLVSKDASHDISKVLPHRYPIRLILHHTCNYCNMEFDTEREKNEHDLRQHV